MDTSEKFAMNCEQAEALVLDLDRNGAVQPEERAAALAHVSHCSRCAALQESWEAAREDLRALGAETQESQASDRVKMRLMLEFRAQHHKDQAKRLGFAAAWVLAGAAVAVLAIGVRNAERHRRVNNTKQGVSAANGSGNRANGTAQNQDARNLAAELTNGDDSADFTPLPGALPGDTDDDAIVRVRMQRSSLSALGFPVNEQRAAEWIQVDLLVGNDGLPQAVRLAPEEN